MQIERPGVTTQALAFAPDGRRLAVGTPDGGIHLLDTAMGQPSGKLAGHRGIIHALQFAPDGKTLYSASGDTTVLGWDMTRVPPLAALPLVHLPAAWTDLADTDGAKAHRAVWSLVQSREQALPFLTARLRPAPMVETKQLRRWFAELDSDDFDTRDAAARALQKLGPQIETEVNSALKDTIPLETRRRLEQLLTTMHAALPPEDLPLLRAVQVLERIGTPAARTLLQSLAKGAAGARLTREARESLERLAQRATLDAP
jgi:WD domain, G-beta repeat